jgi:uncharacterized membrane protein YsdA (DUF1294 family)
VRAAFAAAGVLYGLVAILLAASLPARVPIPFGTDLTAERWTSRSQLMLLICVLGMLLVGLFAGLATQVSRASADLWHIGAVTLLFLAVELALVYGGLGAYVASSSFPSQEAEPAGIGRLSPWTAVLLAGYLAYVFAWLAWLLTGHPGPRQDAVRGSTADSTA